MALCRGLRLQALDREGLHERPQAELEAPTQPRTSLILGLRVPSRGLGPGSRGRDSCAEPGAQPRSGARATRCPSPPGLVLRRCELDEDGIAYWEPPTYIRCVSIDYRNIQMMVGAGPASRPAPPVPAGVPLPRVLGWNPGSPE